MKDNANNERESTNKGQINILHINHYVGFPETGMKFRPYNLAREWSKMDHEISIIVADYSHLRKQNLEGKRGFVIMSVDGIKNQWIRTCRHEDNGVARPATMAEFCCTQSLHVKMTARKFCPEVVIRSSTYPLDTYPAHRIAHHDHRGYVHKAHNLWPLTLTEIRSMSKTNPFVVLTGIAERTAEQ